MDDFTVALVFLMILVVSWFMTKKRLNLPPGPRSLPVVGALAFMKTLRQKPAYEVISQARKQYGDIFSFQNGSKLFVVLNGYDVVHQALVKQANILSGRPNFLLSIQAVVKMGKGVIFENYITNGSWFGTLQTLRDFGVGKTSLENKVNVEIGAISKILVESKGQPLDVNSLLLKAVGNVIYGIAFGRRFDFEDPKFLRIRKMIQYIIEGPGLFNPANYYPKALLLLLKSPRSVSDISKNTEEIQSFICEQVREHETTYDENNIRDFIDLYIQCSKKDGGAEKNGFTKGNMMRVIIDLFLAGSDTTSTALTWAFLFMSEFPDVQRKCQEEILDVIGDKVPEYSDRDKMIYVEATLREIQRHANVSIEDTTLCGFDIPKDTIVLANIASTSMDEKFWKNASKFDPGRFINEEGKLIRNDAWIPFSVGPRVCLGESLAKLELFLVFTALLQRFTFRRQDDHKTHSLKSRPTIITNIPEPFKVRAQLRT